MKLGLLQSASSREQKKLAPRIFFSLQALATVYAMVVFPVPADPLIQNILELAVASTGPALAETSDSPSQF
jgi:hypothetical protein